MIDYRDKLKSVRVCDSGERIYITPVLRDVCSRKISIYNSGDGFAPMNNPEMGLYPNRPIAKFLYKFWATFKECVKHTRQYGELPFWVVGNLWRQNRPYIAAQIRNDLTFSTKGSFYLHDPNDMTDMSYIAPSQKFLTQRYNEMLDKYLNSKLLKLLKLFESFDKAWNWIERNKCRSGWLSSLYRHQWEDSIKAREFIASVGHRQEIYYMCSLDT